MAENKNITLAQLRASLERVDGRLDDAEGKLNGLSLGIASDGLIYIFVNGTPVGTGIPQGASGDVFGYVDENNTIVLNGNLADGTYSVKYEMANGDVVNIGNLVLDSNVYYSVTSTLTNCTSNNSTKTVVEGGSYAATITAKDGYELKSVVVTMGGSPVSVSGGSISIANVTGDIVITAVAEESKPAYTNLAEPNTTNTTDWSIWCNDARFGSDGGYRQKTGTVVSNYIPYDTSTGLHQLRIKGMTSVRICMYNSDKGYVTYSASDNSNGAFNTVDGDFTNWCSAYGNVKFVRVEGVLSGSANDVIITVDEEIV